MFDNQSLTSRATEDLLERFFTAIGSSPEIESRINLHEPELGSGELGEVTEALRGGFISSVGPHVDQFASELVDFTGVPFAVPIVNGTSALQLALFVAGVKPGDEVIVPALSFVATANAVSFLGANPVFIDSVNLDTDLSMGMSPDSLKEMLANYRKDPRGFFNKKSGARLAAVVPMHTLGRLVDLEEIESLLGGEVPIVEDAAEALGSFRNDEHPGIQFDAILSFNGNKIITTGGGGALLTASPERAELARRLSTTAKIPHSWEFAHSDQAWNFRMPALNAAVGVAQMKMLPTFLERKQLLADRFLEAFADSEYFEFIKTPDNQRSNNWLNAVRSRDADIIGILDRVNEAGVHCRPMWNLLPSLNFFKNSLTTNLKNAEEIRQSVVCLPSSASLLET
jgi:perosamine synthetase